jgi:hypothetical protein
LILVAWLEELYPSLFEKVKKYAKTGNFVPIGIIILFLLKGVVGLKWIVIFHLASHYADSFCTDNDFSRKHSAKPAKFFGN